jgi:hypothetical protein
MTLRTISSAITYDEFILDLQSAGSALLGIGVVGCELCTALKSEFVRIFVADLPMLGLWLDLESKSQIRRLGLNYIQGFPMLVGFQNGEIAGAWEGLEIGVSAHLISDQLATVVEDYKRIISKQPLS